MIESNKIDGERVRQRGWENFLSQIRTQPTDTHTRFQLSVGIKVRPIGTTNSSKSSDYHPHIVDIHFC